MGDGLFRVVVTSARRVAGLDTQALSSHTRWLHLAKMEARYRLHYRFG